MRFCGRVNNVVIAPDSEGETKRIPDAKSFRPFKKGMVGLKKFRTETVGQLIFVNLNDDGPGLKEYLGPLYAECERMYSDEWEQIWVWQPR